MSPPPGPIRLPSLSIVLPCFDEQPNVANAVAAARRAAARFAAQHEIVVVDDGSRDRTREIAAALALADPRVRLVAHDHNRGYGAAVRSGLQATHCDWVLLTDGDLQFDLGELALFIARAGSHELVAGYRIDRADPLRRRAAARAWNVLVDRSFGVGLRDVDCAFKLMRGPAVRELALDCEGAMVSTELLVRARLAGWRVAEVGVHHHPRVAGQASGGDVRVVARAFRERRALLRRLEAEARGAQQGLLRPRQSPAT
jgi:glycosyltransferase involved in cell wall biosynthesis